MPTTSTRGAVQRVPSLVTLYLAKQLDFAEGLAQILWGWKPMAKRTQHEGMEKAAAWPARATAATMRLLVYILDD